MLAPVRFHGTRTSTDMLLLSSLVTEKMGEVANLLGLWFEIRGMIILQRARLNLWRFSHICKNLGVLSTFPSVSKHDGTDCGCCIKPGAKKVPFGSCYLWVMLFDEGIEGNLGLYCSLNMQSLCQKMTPTRIHSLCTWQSLEPFDFRGGCSFWYTSLTPWHKWVWWSYSFKLNVIFSH